MDGHPSDGQCAARIFQRKLVKIFELVQEGDADKLAEFVQADPSSVRVRNAEGMSPVMLAAYLQRGDLIDIILEAGPPLDFFEAAAIGEDSLVRDILLEDHETVNRQNFDGFTALHLASFFGHEMVVEVLLGAGADPNAVTPNEAKLRPLHSAVANRSFEIVERLLDYGADPNVTQHGGWTPLMAASKHGDLSLVWLLVERGADLEATGDDGRTAAQMAEAEGHFEVVDWLRKSSAQ